MGGRRWSGRRDRFADAAARSHLSLDGASLGAISLGGVRPSVVLARGRRICEVTSGALRRADAFFAAERLPTSQNPF